MTVSLLELPGRGSARYRSGVVIKMVAVTGFEPVTSRV
jgi:hypothetical protein